MAIGNTAARRAATIDAPGRAANTNDDVLTLDWSGYAEGYGFGTYSFAADSTGGYKGYYYLDGATRLDFVSIERFDITGTDYADTIQTGDGADVIKAGGGNDRVYSGLGKDTLDGGSGIDGISRNLINSNAAITINLRDDTVTAAYGTIRNFEYFLDFTGTSRNDTFISSAARGNDNVNGGDGNDRIELMRGADRFTGGGGNDTLKADFSWSDVGHGITSSLSPESGGQGFSGYYYLDGGNRADFGTTENFEVIGTKYNDQINGASGNDIVAGGAGDDTISTGAGTDALDGGDGVDGVGRDFSAATADVAVDLAAGTQTGAAGSIVNFEYFLGVTGGLFNDSFTTTTLAATDRVNGGGGDDTGRFYNGYDYFDGGLGNDRAIVDYSANTSGEGIQTSLNVDTNGGYRGYLYVNGQLRTDFTSTEAFTVTGTAFNDTILTGDGNDTIAAGAGYDVVRSGGGDDVLDGGAGIDGLGRDFTNATANITINLGNSSINGIGGSIAGFEYFTGLITGSGNDRLISTRSLLNDSLNTGGGNDTFTSYGGYDSYTAGLGNDRLVIDWSQTALGIGINSVSQNADTNGGYQGYFYISNQARVDYSSVESFDITATNYDDRIQTQDGNDTLNGLAGNDVLIAGAGTDAIDGGDGIDGFAKDFTAGRKPMVIDLNDNSMTNTDSTIANVEYLYDVRTGSGADKFVTLAGKYNDTAWGGGGNDTAYFFSGYDTFNGQSGTKDTLVVDYSALDTDSGMSSSVSDDSSNGGFRGYFYVEGDNRSDFTGTEIFDITGTKNDDSINGGGNGDTLSGGDGRDTISGGGGKDVIDGGLAGDTLYGNDGDDRITGGKGSDTMTGGTGADTFVFANGDSGAGTYYVDRITDFNRTTDGDKIDLSRIDADSVTTGNQAFTFISTAAFTDVGQIHLVTIGGIQYIQGNVNTDLAADFTIRVDGETPIATDFVL